jgi:hypothetical protein
MKKVLVIALLAVASAAEAQNVVPVAVAAVAPLESLQEPAPAPPAQPPAAPARPPSAPRSPGTARPAAPAPAAAPAAPVPPQPAQAPRAGANVRFDVTITDTGGAKPVTKTLSLTVGNYNNSGSIRSTAQVPGGGPTPFPGAAAPPMSIPLYVDVRNVTSVENNAVRASVLIEYQPYVPEAKSQPGGVTASAQTIFFDGRRTQILVTSDPISDRKTTIEVTATILK